MSTSIYFLAILPPDDILEEVATFKYYARDHFDSARALRSPAHITLEPPFKWEDDRISELKEKIQAFDNSQTAFPVSLHNFSSFPPRVIFVDVVLSAELEALQAALKLHMRNAVGIKSDRPERPYHPHMTVAFKDLRKSMYGRAWEYFKQVSYERSFEVSSFWILKHDGKIWQKYLEVPF